MKGFFSKYSPGTQMIVFVLLVLLSFLTTLILSYVFGLINTNPIALETWTKQDVFLQKINQAIQSLGLFIIPSFLAAYLFDKQGVFEFFTFKKNRLNTYFGVFFIVIFSIPIMNFLGVLNSKMYVPEFLDWINQSEERAKQATELFLQADSGFTLMLNLLVIALIPAIGEELLFRGVFQKLMHRISGNVHIAIWITAFLFSAVHMQFLTFLPRLMMGAMFGYLLVWSGSLIVPILAHFINNGFAVLAYYLSQKELLNQDVDTIGTKGGDMSYLLISVVLVGLGLYSIYRNETNVR